MVSIETLRNGSAADFGSACPGSNPGASTLFFNKLNFLNNYMSEQNNNKSFDFLSMFDNHQIDKDVQNIFAEIDSYIKKNNLEHSEHSIYMFIIAGKTYECLMEPFDTYKFINLYHKAYVIDTIKYFKELDNSYETDDICKAIGIAIAKLLKDKNAGELGDIITENVTALKQNNEDNSISTVNEDNADELRLINLHDFLHNGYDTIGDYIFKYIRYNLNISQDSTINLTDEPHFEKFKLDADSIFIFSSEYKEWFNLKRELNMVDYISKYASIPDLIDLAINIHKNEYRYYYQSTKGLKELIEQRIKRIQNLYNSLNQKQLNVLYKVLLNAIYLDDSTIAHPEQENPTETLSDTKNQTSQSVSNCPDCIDECYDYEIVEPDFLDDAIMKRHNSIKNKNNISKSSKKDALNVLKFLQDTYGNDPSYKKFLNDISQ